MFILPSIQTLVELARRELGDDVDFSEGETLVEVCVARSGACLLVHLLDRDFDCALTLDARFSCAGATLRSSRSTKWQVPQETTSRTRPRLSTG